MEKQHVLFDFAGSYSLNTLYDASLQMNQVYMKKKNLTFDWQKVNVIT